MGEEEIRPLTREMGEVMQLLQRWAEHVTGMQEELAGMDTRLRLIATSVAAQRDLLPMAADAAAPWPETPALQPHPAPPQPSAPTQPATAGDWAELLVQRLSTLLTAAQANAPAAARPNGLQARTERFDAERLRPLEQARLQMNSLFQTVALAADPDLRPAQDRYAAVMRRLAHLVRQVRERTQPGALAAAQVQWQPPALADLIVREHGGAPRVQLAPLQAALGELEAMLNAPLSAIQRITPPGAPSAESPAAPDAEQLARWETEWQDLIEGLLDLKHHFAEAVARKAEPHSTSGAITAARAIVDQLGTTLRALDVQEIAIERGDPVVSRLHRVVRHEFDPRYPKPGIILRVVAPGYRSKGDVVRQADVVATP